MEILKGERKVKKKKKKKKKQENCIFKLNYW